MLRSTNHHAQTYFDPVTQGPSCYWRVSLKRCVYKLSLTWEPWLKTVLIQVVLRSINSSSSAYAAVTFHSNFFDEYNVFGANVIQAGVLMKVC